MNQIPICLHLLPAVFAATLASLLTIPVASQELLKRYDQVCGPDQIPIEYDAGATVATNLPFGQTFRPAATTLDFIEVRLGLAQMMAEPNPLGAQQAFRIALRETDVLGRVVASTAPVVLTWQGMPLPSAAYDFTFAEAVTLSPGAPYYFGLEPLGGPNMTYAQAVTSHGLPVPEFYPDGVFVYRGKAWSGMDLWFRTGMLIPEPSPRAMLLVSGLGLWWATVGRARPQRS